MSQILIDFVGGSESALQNVNRKQRIILVANSFDARVSAIAVWLYLNKIDLRCIKLNIYRDESDSLLLHREHYLPTPEITSYLPGLIEHPETQSEDNIRSSIIEPRVKELVESLLVKLRSSLFNPLKVQLYRRGWDYRIKMFGKNRAGYYFARKWLRFYLYSPSRAEVQLIQNSVSDKQSVNDKGYEVGFNVRTEEDVKVLLQILTHRFENQGETAEHASV